MAGAALLRCLDAAAQLPGPGEPPFLFCGNGACRDCNTLVDGLPDLPSCRIPVVPGLSLRTAEADGTENALSRVWSAGTIERGAPLTGDVLVVGAGPAGLAAAGAARDAGAVDVLILEARFQSDEAVTSPAPVLPADGGLHGLMEGSFRLLRFGSVVLATGAFVPLPAFPGSTLPGVMPIDLAERYVAHGSFPGARVLVTGSGPREERLGRELLALGVSEVTVLPASSLLVSISGGAWVQSATIVSRRVEERSRSRDLKVDAVVVSGRPVPSLGLARALGCRLVYDRSLPGDRAEVAEDGASSVEGVFLAGDAVRPGSAEEAAQSGARAGEAAAYRACHRPGRRSATVRPPA